MFARYREAAAQEIDPLAGPTITGVIRPWMRWRWQGGAADDQNLAAALHAYRTAGFGGVETTPIYGVAGHQDRFIDYLSPTWMERLTHPLRAAYDGK